MRDRGVAEKEKMRSSGGKQSWQGRGMGSEGEGVSDASNNLPQVGIHSAWYKEWAIETIENDTLLWQAAGQYSERV